MGGKKRRMLQQQQQQPKNKHQRPAPPPPPQKKSSNKNQKKQQQFQAQQREENPIIPFDRDERILLIGEGDLSFAASLITHHRCTNVTATVLDKDHSELVDRYPDVDRHIATINNEKTTTGDSNDEKKDVEDKKEDENDEDEYEYDTQGNLIRTARPKLAPQNRLVYNVNALKALPSTLKSVKDKTYQRVLFNFPHVGGKTTDVSRQIRHNQELLLAFFAKVAPLLSSTHNNDPYSGAPKPVTPSVAVTLFEGEPYNSWGIRDLAKPAGLMLDHSFRFQASAYPGYAHARTLGVVKNKKGEMGGGWKGETRPARTYLFRRKDDAPLPQVTSTKKKRKREDEDSSDDEDED